MNLSQKNILRFHIGYDDFFNDLERVSLDNSISNVPFDVLKYDCNKYEIHVAIAGVNEKQISIKQLGDFLVLEVNSQKSVEKNDFIHKGIRNNSFKQSFRLEHNIEVKQAEIKNGILQIKLYKKEVQTKSKRKIEIIEE
ncbi:MAG: Hsp20 family protein [Proteobacteria bacterium]|jgi:molecular chaperone IbpA|nr:Hsp20 family protein [Pseudomonadota bacterium]